MHCIWGVNIQEDLGCFVMPGYYDHQCSARHQHSLLNLLGVYQPLIYKESNTCGARRIIGMSRCKNLVPSLVEVLAFSRCLHIHVRFLHSKDSNFIIFVYYARQQD